MKREFYRALQKALEEKGQVEVYTILNGSFNGLDLTSSKAICPDRQLVSDGTEAIQNEFWKPMLRRLPPLEEGGPCFAADGGITVLRERLCSRPRVVLCGGGHISQALAPICKLLDFEVTVLDDRPEFADPARFAGVNAVCADFSQGLAPLCRGSGDYFVIVTRGHSADRLCLEEILRHPFAYCGMIGSRRKVALLRQELEQSGYEKELLDRVYAPIGLSIGAVTPAEIAVCIAAQLIEVRSKGAAGVLDARALQALAADGPPLAVAQIIEKTGSAPRDVGTRLVSDGKEILYGTVGGGAAEAAVIEAIPKVLQSAKPVILSFDMTNADAQKEGMVCGGKISVLIDPVF